jgi:hypothetical protein
MTVKRPAPKPARHHDGPTMRSDLPESAASVSAAARWPAHRVPGKPDPDEYGNGDNNAKHNQRHGNLLGSHPLCALFTMLVTVGFKRNCARLWRTAGGAGPVRSSVSSDTHRNW